MEKNADCEDFFEDLKWSMKKIIAIFVLFVSPSIFAENAQVWGEILFPQTKKWKVIEEMPRAIVSNLKLNHPCNFVKKIKGENSQRFFVFDVDGDNEKDIIYSGKNPCDGGDLTYYWKGPRFKEGAPLVGDGRFRLLKVGTKKEEWLGVKFSDDEFGEIVYFDSKANQSLAVYNQTMIPKEDLIIERKDFVAKNELHLRSWPNVKDDFNELMSKHLKKAILGNHLAIYFKGAKGTILYSYDVAKGETWHLVQMSDESNYLKYYFMNQALVGWVRSSDILIAF